MARKNGPAQVRPKTPARVKRPTRNRPPSGCGHPELIGLALPAVGTFLASVRLFGWDGGVVGEKVSSGLERTIGDARFVLPLALVAVGGLMVARSGIVDLRPF